MRKEKKRGNKEKEEKTDENSGHFIVCQQSTARTTTAGTPHARANNMFIVTAIAIVVCSRPTGTLTAGANFSIPKKSVLNNRVQTHPM